MDGKTIFISGGSRGIGLAIAEACARAGANVAIAAKTDQPHPKLPGTISNKTGHTLDKRSHRVILLHCAERRASRKDKNTVFIDGRGRPK